METENIHDFQSSLDEVIESIKKSSISSDSRATLRSATSIRCRPLLKGIMKSDLLPYLLSFTYRSALRYNVDELFLHSLEEKPESIPFEPKDDLYDYQSLQAYSNEYLIKILHGIKNLSEIRNRNYDFIEVAAAINKRRRQEDKYFYINDIRSYHFQPKNLQDKDQIPVLGIFDGHLGPEVAEHCSHFMPYYIAKAYQDDPVNFNPITVLCDVFFKTRVSLYKGLKLGLWKSGCTATVCIIYKGSIYTAWVGDSQAWLVFDCSSDEPQKFAQYQAQLDYDEGMPLTDMIHKPSEPEEFVSVTKTGGVVVFKDGDQFANIPRDSSRTMSEFLKASLVIPKVEELDGARIGGQVNLSRSFGDEFNYPGMHSLPSITVCKLNNRKKPISTLILASDGLWDDIAGCGPNVAHLVANLTSGDRKDLANRLLRLALESSSTDNVTILVAHLDRLDEKLTTNSEYSQQVNNLKVEGNNSHHNEHNEQEIENGIDSDSNINTFFPNRRTLWPTLGKNRVSSLINLSSKKISDRGPNGFTQICTQARRASSSRLQRWFSEGELLDNLQNSITLSSPVRILDTE